MKNKLIIYIISLCLLFSATFGSSFAQLTHTDNEDNLGVITDRQSNSPNFIMDTVMDVVGGDSNSQGSVTSGVGSVQHGYFFIDQVITQIIQVYKLIAVPEKRIPPTGNSATIISRLEVRGPDSTYLDPALSATTSTTTNQIFWTDSHGVYDSAIPSNQSLSLPNIAPGTYDVYVKGYSTLTKRVPNVPLVAGQNELQLTALEADISNQPLPTDPDYYLLGGDVNIILDPDNSCGFPLSNCHNVLNAYTGDEIGDDKVNSIDVGVVVQKLFRAADIDGELHILKEDLNGDGKVNSLDLGVTVNNILKTGGV